MIVQFTQSSLIFGFDKLSPIGDLANGALAPRARQGVKWNKLDFSAGALPSDPIPKSEMIAMLQL
jgi:hypothetical protein